MKQQGVIYLFNYRIKETNRCFIHSGGQFQVGEHLFLDKSIDKSYFFTTMVKCNSKFEIRNYLVSFDSQVFLSLFIMLSFFAF